MCCPLDGPCCSPHGDPGCKWKAGCSGCQEEGSLPPVVRALARSGLTARCQLWGPLAGSGCDQQVSGPGAVPEWREALPCADGTGTWTLYCQALSPKKEYFTGGWTPLGLERKLQRSVLDKEQRVAFTLWLRGRGGHGGLLAHRRGTFVLSLLPLRPPVFYDGVPACPVEGDASISLSHWSRPRLGQPRPHRVSVTSVTSPS